jgi:hypothetical protein
LNLTKSTLIDIEKFEEEKLNIKNTVDTSLIFDYIIELVEVYTDLKAEIFSKNQKEENKNEEKFNEMSLEAQQESYESLIRKLENDLRNHMRVYIF